MTRFIGRPAVLAMALVSATAANAGTTTEPAATPLLEQQAIQALDAMSSYLRSLTSFTVNADVSKDEVMDDGLKLQFDKQLTIRVDGHNKMFMDVSSPQRHRQYYYDGKRLTLYSPDDHYYAGFDTPATIGKALDAAEDKYGVTLPLSDLFRWGTDTQPGDGIEGAIVVGPGEVNGVSCSHYAYHQAEVDWQLCIGDGEQPLPLKLIITTTSIAEQPQYVARMHWDLTTAIPADSFRFTPPPGAMKIAFRPLAKPVAAKQ